MAQLEEAGMSSVGEGASDGKTNGTYLPKPYLEMPTQPWTNDIVRDTPDQSSAAFHTAHATPTEGMGKSDGFPFHSVQPGLDGTVTHPYHLSQPEPFAHAAQASDDVVSMGKPRIIIGPFNEELNPERSAGPDPKTVSFANNDALGERLAPPKPFSSMNGRPTESMKPRRSERYLSKMKAPFALKLASQYPLAEGTASPSVQTPPASPRGLFHRRGPSDGDQADADVEETGDEGVGPIRRPASKRRRLFDVNTNASPHSPQSYSFPSSTPGVPRTSSEQPRYRPTRRSTVGTAYENKEGLSEDEGRARMKQNGDWRSRSSAWVQGVKHQSPGGRRSSAQDTPSRSRPRHFRRTTAEDGSEAGPSNSAASPSPWRLRSEPTAHKWRQLKAGLKLIGQKKKEQNAQDQAKSTELVTELVAGAPAACIVTSHFIRDERHQRRIPVLLEQLKFKITDSEPQGDSGPNRNIIFRIELEYGSGDMRMKWVIYRSMREFWNLHVKFGTQVALAKIQRPIKGGKKVKIPRFPRTAFPFVGDFQGHIMEDEEEEEQPGEDPDNQEPTTPAERPKHRRGASSIHFRRRSSINIGDSLAMSGADIPAAGSETQTSAAKKDAAARRLAKKQRGKLEAYLKAIIKFVMFRPGMNRMCAFLELSALGIKLAVEGGYHGKEGFMRLQSGKGIDFRREWVPKTVYNRHKPMWFLVRSSYIVCVDSPASMDVYDVFLIDGDFTITPKRQRVRDQKNAKAMAKTAGHAARHPQTHLLRLSNSERKLRMFAKNERQLEQFETSMRDAAAQTPWSQKHRFGSFAPVRTKVYAQWLVDGRDYMWNVSRALSMARDVIYIHDWWLSPELYMRRPGAISHKWRLDRILKRKAEEGVKIFVILYRNIESAIPIDSEYSKHALLDLHKNIFVQRSPNQYRSNVFFWAHHEKICVVDQTVAFCGGVDLCYGRWDTPDHRVVDDRPTGWEMTDKELNSDTCQMWAGKDYSNARVRDFFELNQPFSEMYDRTKVPRMPWHDIGMQIVGQPARDLTRHFVQRWNYLLRIRKTTRPTPFLMPPPDFSPKQLEELGLEGTCTIQMLRSACEWSLGTPKKTEHSIMTAYCKLIQTSEHFVYIENQFFISSCVVEGTKVHNAIGDALVERAIRAHENGEAWSAVIVIPLMPGFEATVDTQDGTSVRLIMQCQYRSICRGESSIFERLSSVGIKPTDYIRFFSLRSWGKIGPTKALVTEQLYIHAKVMVVDDRHAIIGSANINERSMLGNRDSEVAACVFDNDMIESTMAERPYKVGRFPHTLRLRLMREHLGLDVDHIMDFDNFDDVLESKSKAEKDLISTIQLQPSPEERTSEAGVQLRNEDFDTSAAIPGTHTFNYDAAEVGGTKYTKANKHATYDHRVTGVEAHRKDVDGFGIDNMHATEDKPVSRSRDTVLTSDGREILLNDLGSGGKGALSAPAEPRMSTEKLSTISKADSDDRESTQAPLPPRPDAHRLQTADLGLPYRSQLPALPVTDDTDIGGPPLQKTFTAHTAESLDPLLATMRRPVVEKDCMIDPLNRSFLDDTWQAVAENNTKLYRQVFKCMPDSQVTNWTQYHAAMAYAERFAQSQGMDQSHMKMQQEAHSRTGPPGHQYKMDTREAAKAMQQTETVNRPKGLAQQMTDAILQKAGGSRPSTSATAQASPHDEKASPADSSVLNEKDDQSSSTPDTLRSNIEIDTQPQKEKQAANDEFNKKDGLGTSEMNGADSAEQPKRRRRNTTKSSGRGVDPTLNRPDAEAVMNLVQGNLIEWPYDW